MGALDFESQFVFYSAFHTNLINILIHIPCVPTIFWTFCVLQHALTNASLFEFVLPLPQLLGFGADTLVRVTVPFLYAASYATYFVLLEPVAGLLYAPLLLLLGHTSNVFYDTEPHALKYAGYVFAAAWAAQFIGHGKFEGRAPALLTSLFQSLVLAVFFVWLEVLFFLGYRPELRKRLQNKTGLAVSEYRRGLAKAKREKKAQ